MKKISLLLLFLLAITVSGQVVPNEGLLIKNSSAHLRTAIEPCTLCDEGSVFCNTPSPYAGVGLSDDQRCFVCYDNFYDVNSPIGKITFWGSDLTYTYDYVGCIPSADESFVFAFYENADGAVGNLVASFQAIPTKVYCLPPFAYQDAPIYKYEVELPAPITMTDGWLSILGTGGTDGCWFGWCIASSGDNFVYQACNSSFSYYDLDLAFTLGPPAENPGVVIPISSWALFLAIGLIITIAVFRFRKL